jgi:hypothetical protein
MKTYNAHEPLDEQCPCCQDAAVKVAGWRIVRILVASTLFLAALGCGDFPPLPEPDYSIGQVDVFSAGAPDWVTPGAIETVISEVESTTGRRLGHVRLAFVEGVIDCGGVPAAGCYTQRIHPDMPDTIQVSTGYAGWVFSCVASTALPHELLHAVGVDDAGMVAAMAKLTTWCERN